VKYFIACSPVLSELAWEIESFLVRHFEYGNYSFRSALRGWYGESLKSVFYAAKSGGMIVGASGGLYSRFSPVFGVLGPVCVEADYRRSGIGEELVERLLEHLYCAGCRAVYLGVSGNEGAVKFYKSIGFEKYRGIVMRKLLCSEAEFVENFRRTDKLKIRRMGWGDFASVSVLMTEPSVMYSFDFQGGIFSSRYFEPERFLGVFPKMMESFKRDGGFGNLLLAEERRVVVGIAHIRRGKSRAQSHLGVFDFFVHDNFLDTGQELARRTIGQSGGLSISSIVCYCPCSDSIKKEVLVSLGFKKCARIEGFLRVGEGFLGVDVYRHW